MRKCFSPNFCFRWGDKRKPPRVLRGPLKPALPVYLTWRNDPASESEKIVVAVEFLPK
jgi:hypothetical protein